MLAAWSTNSSNRDSCGSTSSDGSFYTDADFASAVAAAAESAGMQVVGSTIVDPSKNGKILGRIHKNEQLLDWPFTRLLLESLYIKTSNYLQVKDHGLWTEQLLIPS